MTKPIDGVVPGLARLHRRHLSLQELVDGQITQVLDALNSRPDVRDNTIVVFLADHGEYLGSHGMCCKGYAIYDKSIQILLIVKDPTGRWAKRPDVPRRQNVSMVDIFGMMLTLATGGNDWRARPEYEPISKRLDVAAVLQDPKAPGRDYVLHTCDEWSPIPLMTKVGVAQNHIVGLRSAGAKLGVYSDWQPNSTTIIPDTQQFELYDYSKPAGRAETQKRRRFNPILLSQMRDRLVGDIIPNELQASLPDDLAAAQARGYQTYYDKFKARLTPAKPPATGAGRQT